MTGLYQATQCVGAILIAPLAKAYPIRSVLSMAVLVFGVLSAVLLIVDASTGGRFKTASESGNSAAPYGNPNVGGVIAMCVLALADPLTLPATRSRVSPTAWSSSSAASSLATSSAATSSSFAAWTLRCTSCTRSPARPVPSRPLPSSCPSSLPASS